MKYTITKVYRNKCCEKGQFSNETLFQIDVDEKEVGMRRIDFSIETLAREEILL